MGQSHVWWEEDTLVVRVTGQNDKTWFDRTGHYHTEALVVTERYTLVNEHDDYSATIEDPNVYSRPWTINMPIYKRVGATLSYCSSNAWNSSKNFSTGSYVMSQSTPIENHHYPKTNRTTENAQPSTLSTRIISAFALLLTSLSAEAANYEVPRNVMATQTCREFGPAPPLPGLIGLPSSTT